MAGSRGSISSSLVLALPFFVLGFPEVHILTKWPRKGQAYLRLRVYSPSFLIVKNRGRDLMARAGLVTFLEPIVCPILVERFGSALPE